VIYLSDKNQSYQHSNYHYNINDGMDNFSTSVTGNENLWSPSKPQISSV